MINKDNIHIVRNGLNFKEIEETGKFQSVSTAIDQEFCAAPSRIVPDSPVYYRPLFSSLGYLRPIASEWRASARHAYPMGH